MDFTLMWKLFVHLKMFSQINFIEFEVLNKIIEIDFWFFDDDFLQLTGSPLSAAKRMQFNMEMKPIPQIEIMKTMPDIIYPLFWVEEGVDLDKDMTKQLKPLFW